jgi:thiosulfate/3-mercaptopyruvate sulfurtransferase
MLLRILLTIAVGLSLSPVAASARSLPWIVGAQRARALLTSGALLLDVRQRAAFARAHWPGAKNVRWETLARRGGKEIRGELASLPRLKAVLVRLGVSTAPVIVVGDPKNGWGEDGRIVWTLRSLGHRRAALVDGGWPALAKGGLPAAPAVASKASPPFVPRLSKRWRVRTADVKRALSAKRVVFDDSREPREFAGKTPYGERRGGHLPGAVHLFYKRLLDANGLLLPTGRITTMLREAGITKNKTAIVYCTGGVRSAFLTAVLVDLGYPHVKNYDGSMWQWAAGPSATYPLSRD